MTPAGRVLLLGAMLLPLPALAQTGSRVAAAAGAGQTALRVGVGRRAGPVVVEAGLGSRGWLREEERLLGGGYVAAALELGSLTIHGELGRVVRVAGGFGSPLNLGALPDTGSRGASTGVRALSHGGLGLTWQLGRLAAGARVFRRTRVLDDDGTGWEANLAADPLPGVRLHAALGRAPAPIGIFLPYRKHFALGVELRSRAVRPRARVPDARPTFHVEAWEGAGVMLAVTHPTARSVEVAGDFSEWRPVPLLRGAAGRWTAVVPLEPGLHLLNLRFDGGPWQVPPGLSSADDGFGGRAGVLLVR